MEHPEEKSHFEVVPGGVIDFTPGKPPIRKYLFSIRLLGSGTKVYGLGLLC